VTPRRRQAQSDWPGTYLGGGGDPNNLANAIHAISMHIQIRAVDAVIDKLDKLILG
jgi:hypothetical protein